jgi:Putative beta-lactamase-inhibitor-like, PepSY-like
MKSLIVVFAFTFVIGSVNAQKLKEAQVPASVVSAFHKMYPDLKDYQWNLEDGSYEAEYEINKMEAAVTFDATGNLIETEKEITIKDLPPSCAEYVSKNYSGATIKEASEITDTKGVKTYEAEIKGKDIVFDSTGKFLKEEKD